MALYSLSFMLTTANSHCDRCFWNTLGKTQRTPATMTVRAPGIWGSNTGLMVCRGWPLGKITATTQRYRKQSLKEQKRCFCLHRPSLLTYRNNVNTKRKEAFCQSSRALAKWKVHHGFLQVVLRLHTTRAKTFRWWGWDKREEWSEEGWKEGLKGIKFSSLKSFIPLLRINRRLSSITAVDPEPLDTWVFSM